MDQERTRSGYHLVSFAHSFYAPAARRRGHLVLPLSVRTSRNWFPFSNLSLPQPNVLKLIHNAYYHKTQIKFDFQPDPMYGFVVRPAGASVSSDTFFFYFYFNNILYCIIHVIESMINYVT